MTNEKVTIEVSPEVAAQMKEIAREREERAEQTRHEDFFVDFRMMSCKHISGHMDTGEISYNFTGKGKNISKPMIWLPLSLWNVTLARIDALESQVFGADTPVVKNKGGRPKGYSPKNKEN